MKPLGHLSIYQGDLFTRLKLVCIKNQNIQKNKSKFERPFDGDNGLVSDVEKFELQREFSQRELKIRSNYRHFRITEIRITESKLYEFLKEI